jgi:hypothetical protein
MFRTVFHKQVFLENLAFQCKLASYFPKSWPLIFDFFVFFLLHSLLVWDPNPFPVTLRQKVTVPAVPVLAPKHWDPQPCLQHRRTK